MSYGLKYTIPFANVDNIPCVVNIEQKDYSGSPIELQAGSNPFIVTTDDEDFVYTPKRFSTAKINIVGSDYLRDLYSTSYQEYRVTFYRNNVAEWCGFIKPETYTQDYVTETFELDIECVSAMSTLEYIDYSLKGSTKQFVSLGYLIQKCIQSANANYSTILIPYVYSDSKANYDSKATDILSTMTVSEQDFFDEDGTAMKLNEVLENVCKLLSWTCVDYRGSLYFVDYDHTGTYLVYDSTFTAWGATTVPNTLSVQDIGFKGGDHTLDILGGYTKVKVKDSNYPVGDIFPEETWNEVIEGDNTKITSPNLQVLDQSDYYNLWLEHKSSVFKVYDYTNNCVVGDYTAGGYDAQLTRSSYLGARFVRTAYYKLDDSTISLENCIEMDIRRAKNIDAEKRQKWAWVADDSLMFEYKEQLPCTFFKDGCFYVSGSVAYSDDFDNFTWGKDKDDIILKMKLKVGDKYWNGTTWTTTDSTFTITIKGDSTDFNPIANTKTIFMPYSGASGYIIPVSEALKGVIEFYMYRPTAVDAASVYIKDFALKYAKVDSSGNSNADRIYENIVNGEYVNSADDIEFKITSYNNDGACYSKVMFGSDYLKDNLYSVIEDKLVRPEEALIRRIINRYSSTKIKLTQQIQFTPSLLPIDTLSDSYFVNKKFLNIGGEIDYSVDRLSCKMIEQ